LNYAGKFDAAISLDGQGSRSPAGTHVDSFVAKAHGHVPDGAFVVPDPNLIFNGEFKRAGVDLVLSHDGHEFVVHDYFRGDKRAAISSPDGAHLTGDVVNALTGHVQYAQAAGGIAAAQVIGHVTKLSGSATAIRNGVSVILNNGDNVEKGDVVSTGGDSTLGITFIDGTVFGLSSNARMVLNEMVYDPNGSSNSSLLSLVAGTITFVAGETAKHGDMKIDTPVATMGIRGTAVLTQINFVVPAGGGDPQPQASFQVLVEPNGTTGSYILFDKVTLLPIATVNQAGQMIQISGGNVSISNALMSPDIQKLITDVFTLKFTDNNTNTKLTTNFTDTITQISDGIMFKTAGGYSATPIFTNLNPPGSDGAGHNPSTSTRIPGPPDARSLDANGNVKTAFTVTEHANATGDRADTTGDSVPSDTISGRITFVDQNLGDRPTVSISLGDAPNYVYKSAGQQDVTGSLTALQKQDIAATQIQINVNADGANNNNGSVVWTYTIPDHVFDFLAAGETLTLTYRVRVDNNFSVNPESSFIDITITITGTNDKPVISTSVPTITFEGGTSVPGGPLTSDVPTTGTLNFTDVDLTDKHTVSVALTGATLPDGTVPPGPLAAFKSAMSVAIAAGADSTGDGTGTINWSLADLPVYLADFIPKGEVLTLVYTVTLKDSQGATSQQTITVTITGTDAPAVVWIATDKPGVPSGGFWKGAANWATGTVPTINDDVIVITDQLHGLTPSYPVTIDTAAYAKSITMNDFGGPPPKVINQSSLTISGALNMGADSIFTNGATGAMWVGGKAEILDTSVLTNAGSLTLQAGGDFAKGTTITNSGTIALTGGTLKTLADIANAGGTLRNVAGTTLIVDTATVDGGTVTILGTLELDGTSLIENGTLNNSGAVNVSGTAEFAHEAVFNNSSGTIKVLANGWLTVDQGSTVDNTGAITVDASGKLTVNGATISGGAMIAVPGTPVLSGGTNDSSGTTIVVSPTLTGGTVTNNGELDLTGNAVLTSGILKNNAAVKVSGTGNALDYETVTNAGTIEVLANGALTIDQGSVVTNTGNVTVDATGKLMVNGAKINGAGTITDNGEIDLTGNAVLSGGILKNNAAFKVSGTGNALDNETITNSATGTIEVLANGALTIDQGSSVDNTGNVTVDATGKLTVNGATISGAGTVTNTGELDLTGNAVLSGGILKNNATFKVSGTGNGLDDETVTNAGTIEVLAGGALAIDQGSTVDNSSGNVIIDGNAALTLDDATISGGAIKGTGTIDVTGASKIDGGATVSISAITADAALTLDGVTVSGTVITDHSSIALANTVKVKDGATIKGASAVSKGAITNDGTLEVAGAATLLNDVLTNTNHVIKIDDGQTLTLSGTEITGGTINNYSGAQGGTIDVTGDSKIDGNATLNKGAVTVESGFTLTLDDATVAGTAIANHGAIKVDTSKKLTLNGASLTGGALTVSGTLDSTGTSAIDNADITNTGTITVTSGTLTIDPATLHAITNHGLIQANGGVLDVSGEEISNTAALKAINYGTLKLTNLTVSNSSTGSITVDGTSKLYLTDVSINGGSLSNAGNLYSAGIDTVTGSVTNTGIIEVQSGTLDLAGGIAGAGKVIVDVGATLEFSGATGSIHIVNSGSIVGTGGNAAIHIQQDTTGSVIDNSGTIGPAAVLSVTSATDAIVETDGSLTINNTGHINGNISVATATFNNNAGGTWTVSGSGVFGDASTIVNHGTIDVHGASISGAGLVIDNYADIDSYGTASISGTITNTGTIEVHNGELTLFGSLSGTGSVTVDAGALLKLEGTVTQTVNLAGDGAALEIDRSTFGGSIAELSANDTIDLSTIKYGLGTSAVYVANSDPATGGVLTVTDADGNHISLNLTGADYSNAHFAGSDDGTGHTLITIADDHAPAFTAGGVLAASVSERADATGDFATSDTSTPATGAIDFTDIDLTDLPTAKITDQAVTSLGADHSTNLTSSLTLDEIAALKSGLTLLPQAGLNNGTVTWSYSIADGALDFLAKDQTAKVVSTITITDDYGKTDTTDVTITITGKNDAPVLSDGSLGKLTDSAIADSFSDLSGQLAGTDADSGDTLSYALLNADHNAVATVTSHYGVLTVNANGSYTYVPDAASINALPEGSYSDSFTVQVSDAHGAVTTATYTVDLTGANDTPTLSDVNIGKLADTAAADSFANLTDQLSGADADTDETTTLTYSVLNANSDGTAAGLYGSLHVNANGSYIYIPNAAAINALSDGSHPDTFTVQTADTHGATGTATLTVDVDGANDAPVMDVGQISVTQDGAQVTVHGISVTDADAAVNETFTLVASGSGSNLSPASTSDTLAHINSALQTVTYTDASEGAAIQTVTLTVADSHNASNTVSLLFGTAGQDDFIGTGHQDQFVFAASSNNDTITNFTSGQDHVDLSAVVTASDVGAWMAQHVAASPANSADTLITINASDTILLKGVAHVQASDFIVHA
jgi:VCBS repeat-containing protein